MKVGIKKIHDNDWRVHIGNAAVKMDQFSVALMNITLEQLLALKHGDSHSNLQSFIKLGARIKSLKADDLQKFIPQIDSRDMLNLMLISKDEALNNLVMSNIGGMLAKQFNDDLQSSEMPSEEEAKKSIKNVIEKMFAMEADGQIEVLTEQTEYI